MGKLRFTRTVRACWLSLVLMAATLVALLVACGGGGNDQNGFAPAMDSGIADATVDTGAGDASPGSSDSGATTNESGTLISPDAGKPTLVVVPATATITIKSKTAPATEAFKATFGGGPVQVTWSIDTYAEGTIASSGTYTTTGLVGGAVTVTATYGNTTATAQLVVDVDVTETVDQGGSDAGVSTSNQTALTGTPTTEGGDAGTEAGSAGGSPTTILYPYDKTVMPSGILPPLLQFTPGIVPPQDVLVTLSSKYFTWNGFSHVPNPTVPQIALPTDVWDAALLSTPAQTLTLTLTKAAAGVAYGPYKVGIVVAPGELKGAVYYMTYDTPGDGLYSVQPGQQGAPQMLLSGCLVCHAVSANGTRLAVGTDDATLTAQSGIYDVSADGGGLTQVAQSPTVLGGDSRGIAYATFMPDGQYVMRSTDNFWGGVNQLAWKIDDVAKTLTPATVVGLGANVSAFEPAISPDGQHYAFTDGDGETPAFGTAHRSVSLMDLAVDSTTNTLTFSNRQLLVDNGATGSVTKFVTFLPNPNYIVLEEGENFCTSYGEMLPSWDVTCGEYSYTGSTGRLYMIDATTKTQIELATLDQGNAVIDRQRNYEPFALQVTAGGYFWVVFTSIREYGNTYQGTNVRKQLWVAAISTNPQPGGDPSHPPFFLPNQGSTRNERGFWALEPCAGNGQGCENGQDCCSGYCRPSNSGVPSSPTVCTTPTTVGCSNIGEKCTKNADCCGASAGDQCIGGYCTQPSAN